LARIPHASHQHSRAIGQFQLNVKVTGPVGPQLLVAGQVDVVNGVAIGK
jgi:hypothetical protein